VNHGVLEKDEVHRRATYRLVVLAHEHPESSVQRLVVRQLTANISSRISASDIASSHDDTTKRTTKL